MVSSLKQNGVNKKAFKLKIKPIARLGKEVADNRVDFSAATVKREPKGKQQWWCV